MEPTGTPDDDSAAYRPDGQAVDFLARLTRLLLSCSGEGTHLIEQTVGRAGDAFGHPTTLLMVPEGAVLSVRPPAPAPTTVTVTVRAVPEVFRLDRVVALKDLVRAIDDGRCPLPRARAELARIEELPAPYGPWWKLAGITLFALGFAPLMQPTWWEIGATAVLGLWSAALAVAADRLPRLALLLPLLAAFTVAVLTLEIFARTPVHGGPVLIMLPALFFFVPGDYLSAAAAELSAGLMTTGAIRLVYAVFLLVQLYVGVLLGVAVTGSSTRRLFDVAAAADLPRWALFCGWIIFTVGTVLAFAIPYRLAPLLLLLVYVTVGVQSLVTKAAGEVAGTFAAAVVLAALANLLSRRPSMPPRPVLLLPGFFTLTVGSLGMRGLTTLAGGHVIAGFTDLLKLVSIVTAIALGLVAGAVLSTPRRQLARH
ncbi:threonine/serine exporter family protein [Streptomyces kunmingensis]|uniref:Threonine/serine exporter family protein n=1 Tax=Streptomyces kunmingensis TaxID=68225 RepID=A0ABU6CRN8_9ACTN|nr:threonine/serine exporter family protein [Streptomyces kunmingensis]MEB3967114.1 threonine/serine exporter family protein [Streptomyces kunmingensis]